MEEIIPKQSHSEKYGEDRHPLVIHFATLTKSLNTNTTREVTELILAFEFATSLIEHQQHLINGNVDNINIPAYLPWLVNYLLNFKNIDMKKTRDPSSLKGILKEKQDHKTEQRLTKSIERLVDGYRKFNQEFVALLIPLKVYVPVVTNILGYSDELMTLKTRSINSLSEIVMRGSFKLSDGMEQNEFEDDKRGTYIDNNRIDVQLQGSYLSFISYRTTQTINYQNRKCSKCLLWKSQEESYPYISPKHHCFTSKTTL